MMQPYNYNKRSHHHDVDVQMTRLRSEFDLKQSGACKVENKQRFFVKLTKRDVTSPKTDPNADVITVHDFRNVRRAGEDITIK